MAEKPLGNLFVRVAADVANFVKGMTAVEKRSNKTKTAFGKLRSGGLSLNKVLGGLAFGALAADTLRLGVAAEETASKFSTVFGDAADDTQDFVDAFANAAGLSNTAMQEMIATTGAMAQGMGFASDESADFAQQVTILAADLASFNNVPIEETSRAITSALTGERESLKRLGIVIKQADVDTEALAISGKTLVASLTDQERALATQNLIMQKAGSAIGDLGRTQDSAANSFRTMIAVLRDVQTELGKAFVPVITFAINTVMALFKGLQLRVSGLVVTFAKWRLMWNKIFGDAGDVAAAEDNLKFATIAVAEMEEEILGLTTVMPVLERQVVRVTEAAGAMATALATKVTPRVMRLAQVTGVQLVGSMEAANQRIREMGRTALTVAVKGADQLTVANQRAAAAIAQAAAQSFNLIQIWKSSEGFWSKVGATLGAVGAFVAPFNPLLGAGIGALGLGVSFLKHGGTVAPGRFAVVGEAGPELVEGPATVTPMGGGGDIVIQLVMESGRQLVDAIRVKDKRDGDMRRVIRVPVSAIATG